MAITNGNGPAPPRIICQPPSSVIFAERIGIHEQQVNPLPLANNFQRVCLDKCESLIAHVVPLQHVDPPDAPVNDRCRLEQSARAMAKANA